MTRYRLIIIAAAVMLSSCTPGPLNPPVMGTSSPLNKPAKGSDVEAGPGSLEAVRRQLEGSWALMSYDIYDKGKHQRLQASGDLTYDAYGNLTLRGTLRASGTAAETKPVFLNYSGRATIDVLKHELHLLDLTESGDALPRPIDDQVNLAGVRHYVLNGSSLTLTVNGPDGQPTAASAWKKRTTSH